jgi:YVTN family beta-propeller protein
MGASIFAPAMVLSYDAAAIVTTLDSLESQSNRIGQNIPHLDVGESPEIIAFDAFNNIYVLNQGSNSVSVINGDTLEVSDVKVGRSPEAMTVDHDHNIVYVTNADSGTISVINGTNHSSIANVTVGKSPLDIAIDQSGIVYVANEESNSLSVLHGTSKQVQAGISFDINPFHAGRIECNDITVPTNQYFYVDFRTQCTAQANQGFEFNSWTENLGSNSSRTIQASQGDWFRNTLDWLMSAFSGKPLDTPATLNITRFGSFTATFEKLPPAIPPEILATLFAVVATAFIGSWLTPSFIGWRKAKKQGKN